MSNDEKYVQYPEREVESRIRYFDGQFLGSQDFIDEQRYHVDRTRRLARFLRTPGVANGLEVTAVGPLEVAVASGTALDDRGRQLVVVAARRHKLPADLPLPGKYVVALVYQEEGDRLQGGGVGERGTRGDTRMREGPALRPYALGEAAPESSVGLALLTIAGDGAIAVSTPPEVRRYVGLRLGGPGGAGPTLGTGGDAAPRELRVEGDLRLRGKLSVDDGNAVSHEFHAGGDLTLGWQKNPLRVSHRWTGFPDDTSRHFGAEIANDSDVYKALMIGGNKAAGAGRRVSIWDALGIGTYTPHSKLSLGEDVADTKLALWDRTGSPMLGLGFQAAQFRLHLDAPASRFSFLDAPAGKELMTLLGTGKLGVGRGPEHALDVNGTARAGDVLWGNNDSRSQSRDDAGLRGDAGARSGSYETSRPVNYPSGATSWWHLLDVRHSNLGSNFALQLAGSFYDQRLWFRKVNDDPKTAWRRLISSDDMTVTDDKKVGLGTLTPAAKLSLANDLGNTKLALFDSPGAPTYGFGVQAGQLRIHVDGPGARFTFLDGPAGKELVNILGTGKVGVGRGPEYPLDVQGTLRAGDVLWGNGDCRTQTRDDAGLRGDAGARSGSHETGNPINYPPGATSWWHLLDVRHSNPTNNFALQLAGSFYDQSLWFRKTINDPTTAWRRLISSDDLTVTDKKVGIGRSPDHPLDVDGIVRASDVLWGTGDSRTQTRDNAGLRGDAGARSGSHETKTPINYPPGATGWWHLLDVRHSHATTNYALQLAGSFYDQSLWFRKTNNNAAEPWHRAISQDDGVARPLREQMVHRRPIYGLAGDPPLTYDSASPGALLHGVLCYGIFGYSVPPVQAGATRRFRIYAVYSDNMSDAGSTEVRFNLTTEWSNNSSGGSYLFRLGLTWGDLPHRRDGYSDWSVGQPPGHHGFIHIRTSVAGKTGRLYYLELQAWDFF